MINDEFAKKFITLANDLKFVNDYSKVVTLTRLASLAQQAARKTLEETFILRNNYSKNSVLMQKADFKSDPSQSVIYVLDSGKYPAKYLAEQEEGATRPVKQGGTPIPKFIRRVAEIPENKVIQESLRARKIINKKTGKISENKPFIKKINNTTGIWVRKTEERKSLELLYVLFTEPKHIKKREWFQKSVKDAYDKNLESVWDKTFTEAINKVIAKNL